MSNLASTSFAPGSPEAFAAVAERAAHATSAAPASVLAEAVAYFEASALLRWQRGQKAYALWRNEVSDFLDVAALDAAGDVDEALASYAFLTS